MYLFLSTRQFGSIKLCDPVTSLLAQMSETAAISNVTSRRTIPAIWKYGDIELHLDFANNQIIQLLCDNYQELSLGGRANMAVCFYKGQTSMASAEKELVRSDLKS